MMTTLATLSPPLKRLFDRIDATPVDSSLGAVLELWLARRNGLLFPAMADFDFAARQGGMAGLFACRRVPGEARGWRLLFGENARPWLVLPAGEDRLDRLAPKEHAVRLRRLLEQAAGSGEPVIGTYRPHRGAGPMAFDLLAAPLADDHRHIDAVFCAIAARDPAPDRATRSSG